jgi:hypothetical protein|tara:strand:- start:376 stop:495 length:120 start_codon:yes stop_codon:yes gene_type:complete
MEKREDFVENAKAAKFPPKVYISPAEDKFSKNFFSKLII